MQAILRQWIAQADGQCLSSSSLNTSKWDRADCAFYRANVPLVLFQPMTTDQRSSPRTSPSRSRKSIWLPTMTPTCIFPTTCPMGLSVTQLPPAAREDPRSRTTSAVEPNQSRSSVQGRTRKRNLAMLEFIISNSIATLRSSKIPRQFRSMGPLPPRLRAKRFQQRRPHLPRSAPHRLSRLRQDLEALQFMETPRLQSQPRPARPRRRRPHHRRPAL